VELELGDSFSRAAVKGLWVPVPTPEMESFEFAPRMKNRAAAAIAVVEITNQEGQSAKIVY